MFPSPHINILYKINPAPSFLVNDWTFRRSSFHIRSPVTTEAVFLWKVPHGCFWSISQLYFCCPCPNLSETCYCYQVQNEQMLTKINEDDEEKHWIFCADIVWRQVRKISKWSNCFTVFYIMSQLYWNGIVFIEYFKMWWVIYNIFVFHGPKTWNSICTLSTTSTSFYMDMTTSSSQMMETCQPKWFEEDHLWSWVKGNMHTTFFVFSAMVLPAHVFSLCLHWFTFFVYFSQWPFFQKW